MEPNLNAHTRKIRCFTASGAEPVAFAVSSEPSPRPLALPDGGAVDSPGVRQYAKALALDEATATRRDRVAIYTVGLGNPAASNPLEAPDLPFLQDVANDNGRVDRSQPRGIMVFAADNTELHASFMRVADRILTRLSL